MQKSNQVLTEELPNEGQMPSLCISSEYLKCSGGCGGRGGGGCRCSSQQERRGYVSTVQLFARCTTLITHEPACLWRMKEVFCSVRFLRSNRFRYTVALNNVEIGLRWQRGQEILAKWLSNFELKFWLQSYFWYMLPKNLGNITLHFYSTGGFVYETIFPFSLQWILMQTDSREIKLWLEFPLAGSKLIDG